MVNSKMKVVGLMILAVLAVSIGEAILAKGMKQPMPTGNLLAQIRSVLTNRHVIGGTLLMAVYFGIFMYCLRIGEFSFVLPISALSFVIAGAMGKWYFGENVPLLRWAGIFVIILGVVIVGLGGSDSSHSP